MSEQYQELERKASNRCALATTGLCIGVVSSGLFLHGQLFSTRADNGAIFTCMFMVIGLAIGIFAASEEQASPADWILTTFSASVVSAVWMLLALSLGGATDHVRNVTWAIWAASVTWMVVSAIVIEVIMARTLRRE